MQPSLKPPCQDPFHNARGQSALIFSHYLAWQLLPCGPSKSVVLAQGSLCSWAKQMLPKQRPPPSCLPCLCLLPLLDLVTDWSVESCGSGHEWLSSALFLSTTRTSNVESWGRFVSGLGDHFVPLKPVTICHGLWTTCTHLGGGQQVGGKAVSPHTGASAGCLGG